MNRQQYTKKDAYPAEKARQGRVFLNSRTRLLIYMWGAGVFIVGVVVVIVLT